MASSHENEVVRAAAPYLRYFGASVSGAVENAGAAEVDSTGDRVAIGTQFESAREMLRNLANELEADYRGFVEAESQEDARRKINEAYDIILKYSDVAEQLVSGRKPNLDGVPPDHLKVTLEGIIMTDGTRPTFLIRNNSVVPDPAWSQTAANNSALGDGARTNLERWIPSIGRIGRPPMFPNDDSFAGTGWMVGENVILTNRHVMEDAFPGLNIPTPDACREVFIDFGKETRLPNVPGAIHRANVRRLERVLFAGAAPIMRRMGGGLGLLDVVAFEVSEPVDAIDGNQVPIPLSFFQDDLFAGSPLATIGFPYRFNDGVAQNVVNARELIFARRRGIKQLAPGLVRQNTQQLQANMNPHSIGHDASTLGGNSGSPVFQTADGSYAFGIHYGGGNGEFSSNYAHVVGEILDTPGAPGLPCETLRKVLQNWAPGVHVDLLNAVPVGS